MDLFAITILALLNLPKKILSKISLKTICKTKHFNLYYYDSSYKQNQH